MSARLPTSWGGRAGRYANFKRGVQRFHDPFAHEDLEVALDLQYENWLLARFSPATRSLTLFNEPVHLNARKPAFDAHACLLVHKRDNTRELQLVARSRNEVRGLAGARALGRHLNARLVIRLREDIRADGELLDALDFLRRNATAYSEVSPRLDSAVRSCVIDAQMTSVSAMRDRFEHGDRPQVDAAIARLHAAGEIVITFQKGQGYDGSTELRAG